MIISFAWTVSALLAGEKTMTRREDWSAVHAAHFRVGQLVDAWDRLPRVKGAKKVGVIRVTKAPYRQRSDVVGAEDFYREGFDWLQRFGSLEDLHRVSRIWAGWKEHPVDLWVLEFELVSTICPSCGAVKAGALGHGSTGLRCCVHCALSSTGCRCSVGERAAPRGAYELSADEIRALEEALDR